MLTTSFFFSNFDSNICQFYFGSNAWFLYKYIYIINAQNTKINEFFMWKNASKKTMLINKCMFLFHFHQDHFFPDHNFIFFIINALYFIFLKILTLWISDLVSFRKNIRCAPISDLDRDWSKIHWDLHLSRLDKHQDFAWEP